MVVTLFETDIIRSGLVSCAVGGGVCAGQFIGAWIAVPGGHLKLKLIFSAAGTMGFVAAMAGATDNEQMATALAICSGLMVGLLESIVSTAVTVVIDDQSEIGLAAGVSGSIRAAASVLASKFLSFSSDLIYSFLTLPFQPLFTSRSFKTKSTITYKHLLLHLSPRLACR